MLNLEPRKFSRSPTSDPNCEHLNYSADPQSSQHPLCLASRAYRKDRSAIHHFFGVLLLGALPPLLRSRILRLGRAKQAQGRAATCFSPLTPIARPLLRNSRVYESFTGPRSRSLCWLVSLFRQFLSFVLPYGKQLVVPAIRGWIVVLDRLPTRYSPDGVLRLRGSRGQGREGSFTIHECTVTAISYRYVEPLVSAASIAVVFHRARYFALEWEPGSSPRRFLNGGPPFPSTGELEITFRLRTLDLHASAMFPDVFCVRNGANSMEALAAG